MTKSIKTETNHYAGFHNLSSSSPTHPSPLHSVAIAAQGQLVKNCGCLPFIQPRRGGGGNLVHKHKLWNLTGWEEGPLQSISKWAELTEKTRKIESPQFMAHIFWRFLNGMSRTIWFSNLHFRFFCVDGRCLPFQKVSGKSGWKVMEHAFLGRSSGTSGKVVLFFFFRTEYSKLKFVFHFVKAIVQMVNAIEFFLPFL